MKWRARAAGRRGWHGWQTESFDCVLVDLVMPDMDGIEVCRQITAMRSSSGKASRPSSC